MWHLTCYFASQVNAWREDVIGKIEHLAAQLCDSGKCTQWFAHADSHIAKVLHLSLDVTSSISASIMQVCADVNGPLLELLCSMCSYEDADCVNTLRNGAVLVGDLPVTGTFLASLCASDMVHALHFARAVSEADI